MMQHTVANINVNQTTLIVILLLEILVIVCLLYKNHLQLSDITAMTKKNNSGNIKFYRVTYALYSLHFHGKTPMLEQWPIYSLAAL